MTFMNFIVWLIIDIVMFWLGTVIANKVLGVKKAIVLERSLSVAKYVLGFGIAFVVLNVIVYAIDPDTMYATGRYGTGIVRYSNPLAPWLRRIGFAVIALSLGFLALSDVIRKKASDLKNPLTAVYTASFNDNHHSTDTETSENQFTISYDLDGGYGRFPQQRKKPGETVYIPVNTPIKSDAAFLCWYSDDKRLNGGCFNPGDPYNYDVSVSLKAMWKSSVDM